MKNYKVEFITADNQKHIVFSSGEDELDAIDKVAEEMKKQEKEILDIKII